jgi:hypothetical protein
MSQRLFPTMRSHGAPARMTTARLIDDHCDSSDDSLYSNEELTESAQYTNFDFIDDLFDDGKKAVDEEEDSRGDGSDGEEGVDEEEEEQEQEEEEEGNVAIRSASNVHRREGMVAHQDEQRAHKKAVEFELITHMHDLELDGQHKSQQTRLQERLAATHDHTNDVGVSTSSGADAPPVEVGLDYLSLIRAKTLDDVDRVHAEFGHSKMAMSILSKPMPGLGGSDRFRSTFMQAHPTTPAAGPTIRAALPADILECNIGVEDEVEEFHEGSEKIEKRADVGMATAAEMTAVASTTSTDGRGVGKAPAKKTKVAKSTLPRRGIVLGSAKNTAAGKTTTTSATKVVRRSSIKSTHK